MATEPLPVKIVSGSNEYAFTPLPDMTTKDIDDIVNRLRLSVQSNSKNSEATKVNLNKATAKEIAALPVFGAVTADRIVANRPYSSLEDLWSKLKLKSSSAPLVGLVSF